MTPPNTGYRLRIDDNVSVFASHGALSTTKSATVNPLDLTKPPTGSELLGSVYNAPSLGANRS